MGPYNLGLHIGVYFGDISVASIKVTFIKQIPSYKRSRDLVASVSK